MHSNEFLNIACNDMNIEILSHNIVPQEKDWFESMKKSSYDIWIVTKGKLGVDLNNESHVLHVDDVLFLYPCQFYTAYSLGEECEVIFIKFNAFIGTHFRPFDFFNLNGVYTKEAIGSASRHLAEQYLRLKKNEPMSPFTVKARLMLLLSEIYLFKILHSFEEFSETAKPLALEHLFTYINNNLLNNITVRDLAKNMNMSEKYFISYFKNIMGITPHKYLAQRKFKLAYQYLNDETYTISHVASMLGYSDQYSFSKAFKNHFGYPPSEI